MSKPITIVSVMTLIEQGKIKLDDPVSKYIPSFESLTCKSPNGSYKCNNVMTVYHLMTHRSGLRYYDEFGNIRGITSSAKYEDLKAFADDVSKVVLEFEPGTKYLYGISQSILGRVAEVASGKSFDIFLKESLFDPLEMAQSCHFQMPFSNHRGLVPGLFHLNREILLVGRYFSPKVIYTIYMVILPSQNASSTWRAN